MRPALIALCLCSVSCADEWDQYLADTTPSFQQPSLRQAEIDRVVADLAALYADPDFQRAIHPAAVPRATGAGTPVGPSLKGNHNYDDHWAAAQQSGRMVVLISATSCYQCQVQKAALNAIGEPYAIIDVDSERAQKLIGKNRGIPQLYVFERDAKGFWPHRVQHGTYDIRQTREFLHPEQKSPFKQTSYVVPQQGAVCTNCGGGRLFAWRPGALLRAWFSRPRVLPGFGCMFGRCSG